jgi:hypothetical protein
MNLQQLKTKANTKLSEFWDVLIVRQEAYFLLHDNYFQLLITSPVVDGVDTTFVLTHPSDEAYQLDVNFSFNSPLPFQIQIDTWGSEKEKGFRATATIELLDGRRFMRYRELTDPRVRTQDYDEQEFPQPVGDPYYVGDTSVFTSDWLELIDDSI